MSKEITGSIPYTLVLSEDGKWDIKYESTIHNDMASLAIAQFVMENIAINLREEKKNASGSVKKAMGVKLDKAVSGRFGLQIICDYMLDAYVPYMKYLDEKEQKTEPPTENILTKGANFEPTPLDNKGGYSENLQRRAKEDLGL